MIDQTLYQSMNELVEMVSLDFKRYLYSEIPWQARMIGIVGPRGVGKSTLLLQHIKEQRQNGKYLYVSADNLYFTSHTLIALADDFVKDNGTHLFIDEIHKYKQWSIELKNIYDSHPDLHIVFTGSSVLDILQGNADLSRRALILHMQGLSFREYLALNNIDHLSPFSLEDIIAGKALTNIKHPLPIFREYLQKGYYPFSNEVGFFQRLQQMIALTLEVDIPRYADMRSSTINKLKLLLTIIAQISPYKPNLTKLSADISVSKNNIQDYLSYLERSGLIARLYDHIGDMRLLGKVEKIYLDNTSLMYALTNNTPNIGNLRETFFLNQMRVRQTVTASPVSDFCIGPYTFEVGGQSKTKRQIKDLSNAFVVQDDIEHPTPSHIPLYSFGLNY